MKRPEAPPGHQPALFAPGPGLPPTYRVVDAMATGVVVVTTAVLGTGGTARIDADGGVHTSTPQIAWTTTLTKEQP